MTLAGRPVLIQTSGGQQWGLMQLAFGAEYAGAVVAEGLDWGVQLWQF